MTKINLNQLMRPPSKTQSVPVLGPVVQGLVQGPVVQGHYAVVQQTQGQFQPVVPVVQGGQLEQTQVQFQPVPVVQGQFEGQFQTQEQQQQFIQGQVQHKARTQSKARPKTNQLKTNNS